MSRVLLHWDCSTCDSLVPRGGRGRAACALHAWGIAAPHLSVCHDWWPAGVSPGGDDWPVGADGGLAVAGRLPQGKLFEIHGAHEHFEEVADLSLEGDSPEPGLHDSEDIPF